MRFTALCFCLLVLVLAACSSQPTTIPSTSPPSNPASTVAALTTPTNPAVSATVQATTTQVALSSVAVTPTGTLPPDTPTATHRYKSPTPPPNPGTTVTAAGAYKTLSQPNFFWTMHLPQDWVVTYDRGFEILANGPDQTAFLHLVSQVWGSPQEQLPTARDFVSYWQHYKYGDIFPVYASGKQVSETEISRDKFGGPYLRYEFEDSKKGMHYVEVYASGGGPSSVVLSGWAKDAAFDTVKTTLDDILGSLELLRKP